MSKVKVSFEQAQQFAAQGFEIECYVLPGQPQVNGVAKRNRVIPKDQQLGYSFEGHAPKHGDLGKAWKSAQKKLFADPSKTHTRARIEDVMREHLSDRSIGSAVSKLVYHYKVLRIPNE